MSPAVERGGCSGRPENAAVVHRLLSGRIDWLSRQQLVKRFFCATMNQPLALADNNFFVQLHNDFRHGLLLFSNGLCLLPSTRGL